MSYIPVVFYYLRLNSWNLGSYGEWRCSLKPSRIDYFSSWSFVMFRYIFVLQVACFGLVLFRQLIYCLILVISLQDKVIMKVLEEHPNLLNLAKIYGFKLQIIFFIILQHFFWIHPLHLSPVVWLIVKDSLCQ